MTLACITNHMEGHSCVYRDAHTANCTSETCAGCAPKEARHGMLCGACWTRLELAAVEWPTIDWYLAGIDRAASPDGAARASHGPRLPFTALQVDIDAVRRALASRVDPLLLWASTEAGAKDAVRFSRAVFTITRNYEWKEATRRLNTVRCPRCAQLTLDWTPPGWQTDDVTVVCATDGCGEQIRQDAYETIIAIESTCCRKCRADTCTDRACACHDAANLRGIIMDRGTPTQQRGEFAEPYDPKRPEHRALTEPA